MQNGFEDLERRSDSAVNKVCVKASSYRSKSAQIKRKKPVASPAKYRVVNVLGLKKLEQVDRSEEDELSNDEEDGDASGASSASGDESQFFFSEESRPSSSRITRTH